MRVSTRTVTNKVKIIFSNIIGKNTKRKYNARKHYVQNHYDVVKSRLLDK